MELSSPSLSTILSTAIMIAGCGRIGFDPTSDSAGTSGCPAGEASVAGACEPAITADPALVAYWPLDEPAGATTFRDVSPNGNTGSCSPCPTTGVTGVRGNAVTFADANDSIGVGTGASMTDLTTGITLLAWVKLHDYDEYGYVLSNDRDCAPCGGGAVYSGFSLWAAAYQGRPSFSLRNHTPTAEAINAQNNLPLEEWHFLTGTFDGTTSILYVDAVEVDSNSGYKLAAPPSFETRLGAMGYDPTLGADADIDEVMVFRRALDPAEVSSLYAYYLTQ